MWLGPDLKMMVYGKAMFPKAGICCKKVYISRRFAKRLNPIRRALRILKPSGGVAIGSIRDLERVFQVVKMVKDFYRNPESRRKHCIAIVGETAKALGELLDKESEIMTSKNEGKK
jgi:hypothetical protein